MKGHKVEFKTPFPKVDYVDTILEKTGVNVLEATKREMAKKDILGCPRSYLRLLSAEVSAWRPEV